MKSGKIFEQIFQSSILKGTLYTLCGKVSAMLLYMAFDIACARILRPDDYAEWVFFFAVLTMMFYIGWCGINASAKVFVSKESSKNEVSETIRATFMLRIIASLIVGIIILSIAYPIAKWLGYPDKYPNLYYLCAFAGVLVFLNSITEFFKALYMGLGKFKNLCIITIIEYVGYLFFTLCCLALLKSVRAAAIGYACSGILVFLFGTADLRRISETGLFPKKTDHYRSIMKAVFKYAVPIAISSIGGMILVEMDTFMLGILSSKVQVANYGIAKSLCSKATHLNTALTVGSMTTFSVLTIENIKEKRSKFIKVSNLNILIASAVAGAFLLLGTLAITILYGAEYKNAGQILKYLVPYYVMYSVSNFFAVFLEFQGKAKIRSLCYCTVILLNLILNLIFIPNWGGIGAALATSLSLVPYTILVIMSSVGVFRRYNNQ